MYLTSIVVIIQSIVSYGADLDLTQPKMLNMMQNERLKNCALRLHDFRFMDRDTRGTLFVALRSATQRHKFNQPYQLGTGSKDKAEDAQPFMFYVRYVIQVCDTKPISNTIRCTCTRRSAPVGSFSNSSSSRNCV